MVTDPLAEWWQHPVTIQPLAGQGAYGPVHGDPVDGLARISGASRMVRNTEGQEVLSTVTVTLPLAVGHIPPGSTVTLPPSHGGRVANVIQSAISDAGEHTPNHVTLNLE